LEDSSTALLSAWVELASSSLCFANRSPSSVDLLNHFTSAFDRVTNKPIPAVIHPTGPNKNLMAVPNAYDAVVATTCAAVEALIVPVITPIANVLRLIVPVCAAFATVSAAVAVVDDACAAIWAL